MKTDKKHKKTKIRNNNDRACSVKKVFLRFTKFRRKTPVLELLFNDETAGLYQQFY